MDTVIIPIEYYGQRVDIVLAKLYPQYSRSQLSAWLKSGYITINATSCKPKDKVLGGETVHLSMIPGRIETAQPAVIPLSIVFEDEHLLVINKPAGLVVHPGSGNKDHTLMNALLHLHPPLQHLARAGLVHRLDKDTTGLLIVAKTLLAHTQLVRQLQAREITRRYMALVHGHVISGGRIETAYGRDPRHRLKMAVCKQGREAITHYSVLKHFQHVTLLDIQLETGRTHQIRVHMAHKKHPIVGDTLYGGRARCPAGVSAILRENLNLFPRQALHAYSLSFIHPCREETLTFTIELPDDFQSLLSIVEAEIV